MLPTSLAVMRRLTGPCHYAVLVSAARRLRRYHYSTALAPPTHRLTYRFSDSVSTATTASKRKYPGSKMQTIQWLFGRGMTPQERMRKHQRALEKTQRELDRERQKLEQQEKKLIQDIKKNAKQGQMGSVNVMAKDLVRTRRYIQKFYQMKTQIQAISLRIQTVRSNEQMTQSMKGATQLLSSMNRQINLPGLQRIAMEFEKENDIMDQRQEMMDDAIDDSMENDEEESEEVVNQVLDEIGVDLNQALGETPTGIVGEQSKEGKVAQAVGGGNDSDDLQARLDSLRR